MEVHRPGGPRRERGPCIAVNTLCFLRALRGGSVEALIEQLAGRGVVGIELFDAHATGDLASVQDLARDHGMEIFSIATHACWLTPSRRWQHVDDLASSWFARAAASGVRIVRTFLDDLSRPSIALVLRTTGGRTRALATAVERLKVATRLAREHGITVGIENHWGFSSDTIFVSMLDDKMAGMEGIGWVFDTGNWYRGTDVSVMLDRLMPRVLYVQAKAKRFTNGRVAGTSYDAIAAVLARHDFRGFWSVEYEGGGDETAGVDLVLADMRGALARAAAAR